MIRSEHMESCLTAQIRFMLFKGPGSFKKIFKIGGNVDELKACRLIPFTPPPLFSFYTTFKEEDGLVREDVAKEIDELQRRKKGG